jgi:hypothetical protein
VSSSLVTVIFHPVGDKSQIRYSSQARRTGQPVWAIRSTSTVSSSQQDLSEHFAHCIQIFGGTTAASRRLGIDERALRRFANGERPISDRLLQDTAQALRTLMNEAASAEGYILAVVGEEPGPR